MKKQHRLALVILVFLSLCMYGRSAFGNKKSGSSTVWEYQVASLGGNLSQAHDNLSEMGKQGWELVTVDGSLAYLKRPK